MINKKPSFVSGTGNIPLLFKTIGNLLEETANKYPKRQALISCHQGISLNYTELNNKVDKVAKSLMALGVSKGDRVGIWSPNCTEWVLTQFATAKIGAILVCLNPAYRKGELEYSLNKVKCKVLVTATSFKSSNYISMLKDIAPELDSSNINELSSQKLPHLRLVISIDKVKGQGILHFAELERENNEHSSIDLDDILLDPDEQINIQFTSGTTGLPKGATLSHFNIVNNGFFVAKAMKFTEKDILCIPVPLYHCFGMVMGVLACVSHGSTMVFPNDSFDAKSSIEAIEKYKCTALHGVPTMFVAMLEAEQFSKADFSSLRTGIMAGAPCPVEIMKKVQDLMHMPEVTIAYGMTETSPVSFQSATDDPLDKRVSTVGRVMPHIQVKIISETGATVARGVQGELCTRGYSVMAGYWDDKEKTSEVLDASGWMHTGDLAVLDAEGYGNIVGRVKDMIIRGGENVYPREIEEYLYKFPKIQDAAVFGLPDEKYGEIVAAWIQIKENEDCSKEEILQFCKNEIAHYKVPAQIKLVKEFPMTVSGKIQKFKMRQQMVEELELTEQKTA